MVESRKIINISHLINCLSTLLTAGVKRQGRVRGREEDQLEGSIDLFCGIIYRYY